MSGAQRGDSDRAGFDLSSIFASQQPKLARFLRRLRPPSDTDDLVQRSFLRLLTLDDAKVAAIESPEAYLRRTAANLARDDARVEASRRDDRRISLEEAVVPGPDPIAALEARDMLRRLEDIVSRMPARRREIFLAHRIDGYSYGEIAAKTGISVKGVEKHMSRAIATIDRLWPRR